MTDVRLRVRELVAGPLRRGVPTPLLAAVVRLRVRNALRDPEIYRQARLHMQFLLGKAQPHADFDIAARRYIERMMWRAELRWHPRLTSRQIVHGIESVIAERTSGRGLIINFMHHGQHDGGLASLARAGLPSHVVAAARHFRTEGQGYYRQQLRVISQGNSVVNVAEGSRKITELLRSGACVALATDVPGRTPMSFLGRRVLGSSGATRLAIETDSPIVVLTSHADGRGRPSMRLSRQIEPSDFSSGESLLSTILRMHEEAVLEWPEAVEYPLRRWGLLDQEDKVQFSGNFSGWRI